MQRLSSVNDFNFFNTSEPFRDCFEDSRSSSFKSKSVALFRNEACKVKSSISFLQLSALCIKDFWRCLEVANDVPMVARATNSLVHNGSFLNPFVFVFFKILLLWPKLSEAMDALAGVIVYLC